MAFWMYGLNRLLFLIPMHSLCQFSKIHPNVCMNTPKHCLKPNTLETQFDDFFLIICINLKKCQTSPLGSASLLPNSSLLKHILLFQISNANLIGLAVFQYTGIVSGVWRDIDLFSLMRHYIDYMIFAFLHFSLVKLYIDYIFLLHFGINCSYVRVLF